MGVERWCTNIDDCAGHPSTSVHYLPTPLPTLPHKGEGKIQLATFHAMASPPRQIKARSSGPGTLTSSGAVQGVFSSVIVSSFGGRR